MELDLKKLTPDIRYLKDMESVLADASFSSPENKELYYMYRGIEERNGIRYDITVIPAAMLGNEFVKTKGHYHIGGYQEIYQVLEGEAYFLMQKMKDSKEDEVVDVYVVQCKEGDTIVIPPNYGHVTINPSETKDLKLANWVSSLCHSDYLPFEKLQGACYYYTKQGWLKNEKYILVPELRTENPLKTVPEDKEFLKAK